MLVERAKAIDRIQAAFSVHPAVALLGPRQCGKTTLARMLTERESEFSFFDLEKAVDRRKLGSPEQALSALTGLVVIDEIQRQPDLFETLRVLLDRPASTARFLLLGSASPALIKGVSESLAGRVGLVDLGGFDLNEVTADSWKTLWQRGGFPRSYLAPDDPSSALWRENFVRTFLERDIPQLGITIASETLRRFWTMIAHYHGQVWNAAEFARALGASENTARNYLDILQGAYMLRVLTPWHENLKKRQVKSPKIYIRDCGLLHALLELNSFNALSGHPKLGASFEGFAIEQLLSCLDTRSASFWATHGGAELDLLVTIAGKRYGFECKYSDAPATTRAIRVAIHDLQLSHLWIVYPGSESYVLADNISVLPVSDTPQLINQLLL
jgi:hypothetical protein|tara:strand:- start:942 stop:2099 length:1158 start_codon:yes stop_codon:yes gene_type:complete